MSTLSTPASRRWPYARIEGHGPWALLVERNGDRITRVVLFESEADAIASRPFYDAVQVTRVEHAVNFDRIPDRMDADERRRARREVRAE